MNNSGPKITIGAGLLWGLLSFSIIFGVQVFFRSYWIWILVLFDHPIDTKRFTDAEVLYVHNLFFHNLLIFVCFLALAEKCSHNN